MSAESSFFSLLGSLNPDLHHFVEIADTGGGIDQRSMAEEAVLGRRAMPRKEVEVDFAFSGTFFVVLFFFPLSLLSMWLL